MKKNFHPNLHTVVVSCSCGHSFTTRSTKQAIHPTLCSHCHPFFTGNQKFVDTAGRIDKFNKRYELKK